MAAANVFYSNLKKREISGEL